MPKRTADAASMNETVTKKTEEIEVEGKSYTNTKEMDDILKGETNAKCLSKSKVVYNRRGDEDDTLVFRELYPSAKFDRFGVKGIEKLKWIFYFLLGIMREQQEKIDLMPRSPSVPTAAYGGLIYGKGRFNYAILLFVLLFA